MDISRASCSLGDKYLKRWLQVCLPRTLAELQSIVGKLVWASGFTPNFKEETRPIETLLSCKDTTAMWSTNCTAALNRLVALIFRRMRLGLIDYAQPVDLYVGYSSHTVCTVLTQQDAGVPRPIAIIGRRLCGKEPSSEPLVAELEAAAWAMCAL